jgi:hypothetical protein
LRSTRTLCATGSNWSMEPAATIRPWDHFRVGQPMAPRRLARMPHLCSMIYRTDYDLAALRAVQRLFLRQCHPPSACGGHVTLFRCRNRKIRGRSPWGTSAAFYWALSCFNRTVISVALYEDHRQNREDLLLADQTRLAERGVVVERNSKGLLTME